VPVLRNATVPGNRNKVKSWNGRECKVESERGTPERGETKKNAGGQGVLGNQCIRDYEGPQGIRGKGGSRRLLKEDFGVRGNSGVGSSILGVEQGISRFKKKESATCHTGEGRE